MNSNDIAYTAKVSAAVWMIRKARKIARRLTDATPEQRQAIESEIVEIGQRMYDEMRQVVEDEIAAVGQKMHDDTRQQPQPEVTHDPHARAKSRYEFGDESERDAYVVEVVDQIAESTHDPGEDHELEEYIAAVRELAPDADRSEIEQYRNNHGISPEETAKRWKIWKQVQEFTEQQRKGVNP